MLIWVASSLTALNKRIFNHEPRFRINLVSHSFCSVFSLHWVLHQSHQCVQLVQHEWNQSFLTIRNPHIEPIFCQTASDSTDSLVLRRHPLFQATSSHVTLIPTHTCTCYASLPGKGITMTTNIPESVRSGLMTVQLADAHPVLMPESKLGRRAFYHLLLSAIDQAQLTHSHSY